MDSNIHYNMPPQTNSNLNEEPSSQNEIPTLAVSVSVIQNDTINSGNIAAAQTSIEDRMTGGEDIPPPKADFSAPPPYEVATKLPSYEEVQREKTLQGEPYPQIHMPENIRTPARPLTILAIDTEVVEGDPESTLLGTDFMFFTAFLVAFCFNWIGFLLMMCFCHTIASRYGALSGFGLSLSKWTFIVKHSTDLASRENSWLWWLIMGFGVLICARAIIQYLNIKRGWRLLPGSAQERLLFFY
ncbi:NEDD4 family-interacting protein 1-like [Bombus vosnesenskii]|uniref:NEDD4 family-interacting protein 1-like n=3 Tax=Pyrobombus TaxID=144703 RepID=A0A6J3KWR5_9HYME|nr:NEDD4 family-interacting protein 1-like [Bombus impatiens]XP_033188038.1 NEDD4 family-interacting protein 1-like [Bombus vancouverensis nearcticus]XP_033302335.1 NEDD4 family-interacting protein 1-like [Bombus bifarius]XP_033356299.1 NEDD4 family-interacting protein 1-like [Bombus vosnesenskii]XP_050480227.1 NEDD4 family-interacting protein 1-like [Bombus huntii]